MNKIQVGAAPSPNLKEARSKVGSLQNYTHKPGGGRVKIEHRKLEWNAQPRIEAKNESWTPPSAAKKVSPLPPSVYSVFIYPFIRATSSKSLPTIERALN